MLLDKMKNTLSYHKVTIYDQEHGYNITEAGQAAGAFEQEVAIINSDNLNEKYIYSLPGEDIVHGDLIYWMDNYWLVNERDANTTVYTRAKLLQCNYLLRWVTPDGEIYEQWCAIEDGTKYLVGEYEDRNFVVTRGDSRIAMTIARNSKTANFTREQRFLIDDYESPEMLAYLLTKPLKTGLMYSDHGVYKFVLQEVTATINDNFEERVADYYKYFPKEGSEEDTTEPAEKDKWL